jgi:hypothetical protein
MFRVTSCPGMVKEPEKDCVCPAPTQASCQSMKRPWESRTPIQYMCMSAEYRFLIFTTTFTMLPAAAQDGACISTMLVYAPIRTDLPKVI